MKIAKAKDSKIHHMVTEEIPVNGHTFKSVMFVSHCSQYIQEHGASITEMSTDEALKLVQAGTFCKRCTKRLEADLNPPPPDMWRVELEKSIHAEGVTLDRWNDFFKRSGPIGFFLSESKMLEEHSKALLKTYRFLMEKQNTILVSILTHFLPVYEDWRLNKDFGLSDEKKLTAMPPVSEIRQFSELLRPMGIMVSTKRKNGVFCLGYEFSASWYEEHGFGVMMWCDKPEEFGEGDVVAG